MKTLTLCAVLVLFAPFVSDAAERILPAGFTPRHSEAVVSKTLPAAAQSQRPVHAAPAAAADAPKATRDDILGDYIYDEFRYTASFQGWDYMYCIPQIVAGDASDEVILLGFWADYDTSVYPPVPISQVKATFDYESQTISIPAGASLGKYGDYPAYIYVSDWATDIMQPDPIVLHVDAATRAITYYCDRTDGTWMTPENCLIVTSEADAVGQHITKGVDFIGAIIMNKYNTVMSVTNRTTGDSGYNPIYTESRSDGFTVYNLGGYGYETGLTFSVDTEAGTCTAPVTLWGKDVAVSEGVTSDIYFASVSGGDISGTVTKTDSGAWAVKLPSWSLYDTAAGKAYIEFADGAFYIELPDPAGITGITAAGDGASAAVYYDLTGRRVDAPAAGSLVIAVEGGKASKVLIK